MSLRIQSHISRKIVGYFPIASQFYSKSAPKLPFQSKIISTYSSQWHIWLQQNSACPTWNQSPSPWEDNQLLHIGTPWHQWMSHCFIFRAISMHRILHPINPQHNNCRHRWIHFYSYPYSQDKFRGLSPSINHIHYVSLGRPKSDCSLPFVWRWYTKFSKTDHHTPQPCHTCTKAH